jgi:hypothetical protein
MGMPVGTQSTMRTRLGYAPLLPTAFESKLPLIVVTVLPRRKKSGHTGSTQPTPVRSRTLPPGLPVAMLITHRRWLQKRTRNWRAAAVSTGSA